jgi:hypothetical protein
MQSSAKSACEVVQKLLSAKQQSTLIRDLGNPLGIPCLSCTALTEHRLMSREKMSVQGILREKKRYDSQAPNRRLYEKPSAKGGTGNWN